MINAQLIVKRAIRLTPKLLVKKYFNLSTKYYDQNDGYLV